MKNRMEIVQHANLLADSYTRLTGKPLVEGLGSDISEQARADLIWNAPFAIVSHGVEPDPIFNYGNAFALRLFEYSWDEFTGLSSRFSAELDQREVRAELLAQVAKQGYFDGYHGVRVSQRGRRFKILDATIWNVLDVGGVKYGQAAIIRDYLAISKL